MKQIFSFLLIALMASCSAVNHLQANLSEVTLVKIEPHWYYNNSAAFLLWRDDHSPANYFETKIKIEDTAHYWIGMHMNAVVKK